MHEGRTPHDHNGWPIIRRPGWTWNSEIEDNDSALHSDGPASSRAA
jgi:hypothetical protein